MRYNEKYEELIDRANEAALGADAGWNSRYLGALRSLGLKIVPYDGTKPLPGDSPMHAPKAYDKGPNGWEGPHLIVYMDDDTKY
jgi:hypothetical protein